MANSTEPAKKLTGKRIPDSEFSSRPWRIHEFTKDFVLEDVWELPVSGGPEDLAAVVRYGASEDNADQNPVVRLLFTLRWRLGKILGWDSKRQQVGKRVKSLRDKLPEDLLAVRGPDMETKPFKSVYLTRDEWTAEFSASMGHIIMHIGWVQREDGSYYAQMASLVDEYGVFGKLYMKSILPIRRLVVYPLWFRDMRKRWPSVLPDPGKS